jgi:hypothetical protein
MCDVTAQVFPSISEDARKFYAHLRRQSGKFEGEGALAEFIYEVVLDGDCDESIPSNEGMTTGYVLLRGPFTKKQIEGRATSPEMLRLLNRIAGEYAGQKNPLYAAGFILSEDPQGFVSVEVFESPDQLAESWATLLAADADHEENADNEAIVDNEPKTELGRTDSLWEFVALSSAARNDGEVTT